MKDDRQNDPSHRNRVENFKINIRDEELNNSSPEELKSYSDSRSPQIPDVTRADRMAAERAEREHKLRNKQKRKGNRWFFRFIWIFVVMLMGVSVGQYIVAGINDMLAVGKEQVSVTVDIPQGASTQKIAGILKDAGVINRADFFKIYSKFTKADGNYSSGTYKIDTNMDYEAITNHLQSSDNRVDIVTITFPEGVNVLEIAQLLEKNGVCSQSAALAELKSNDLDEKYDFLKSMTNADDRYYKMEGYLFPDTYDFFKDEEPKQAVGKMLSNSNKKFTDDMNNQVKASGMTLDQVMTLASMIQAEAASEEDMYMISSVFHNRLNSNNQDGLLRLQSDPTTYYPYRGKALVPSNLRKTYTSSYDTYTIKGLPKGPICNPGEKAIDAALHPKDTGYLYFCHDAERNAYYGKTLSQHQQNLKKAGLR